MPPKLHQSQITNFNPRILQTVKIFIFYLIILNNFQSYLLYPSILISTITMKEAHSLWSTNLLQKHYNKKFLTSLYSRK